MNNEQRTTNSEQRKNKKMKDKLMLILSASFLIFVILIFVNAVQINYCDSEPKLAEKRSVTFILGEDKGADNPFFTNAEAYFTLNPDERTDEIITSARSLNEMYEHLNKSTTPYADIHVVVHSNPWAGMSLPLDEGGERITSEFLNSALLANKVSKVDRYLLDSTSRVHIHACGLGNNRDLISALSESMNNAQIYASDGYINFEKENGFFTNSDLQVSYAFYPTAHKPADLHLARQLRNRYPEVEKNWIYAMEDFSYKYNIPVEWEITYPEYDVPTLENDLDKMEWLMNQDELLSIIEKTEIPFDYFRWIIKRKADRIKVYGKVTVLCVLSEL